MVVAVIIMAMKKGRVSPPLSLAAVRIKKKR